MSKVITITLSTESIDNAIREISAYKAWVQRKTDELMFELAKIGAREASIRFASAIYDGTNDVSVSVEPITNGYAVVANGKAAAFIEFGAGVYHNPSEPYPLPRPEGIVGIGEYGQGKGKRRMWAYYDKDGTLVKTRGNPAQMPLWYASKEIEAQVGRIAREVFATK